MATPLLQWLTDSGSLTARLQQHSGGQLQVRILSQRWGNPRPDERQALAMPARQRALIREVLLCAGDQPWVYARSILPATSLCGRLRRLRQLDNRPLGALLFSQPDLRRDPIEIARFDPQNRQLPALAQTNHPLWGRRSCFYLQGKQLLVGEIFLDNFLRTLPPNNPDR